MSTTPTFSDRKTIWVCGFPRSGNTWLARLLGDVLDSPIQSGGVRAANADEGFDRPGAFVIRQQHIEPPVQGDAVSIIRDPRDVAVSNMYYWDLPNLEDAMRKRPRIRKWQDFVRLCLSQATAIVKYESLLRNPVRAMQELLRLIDAQYDLDHLRNAVHRQSFDERRKLVSDPNNANGRFTYGPIHEREKVLRKGIMGDWRNHFTRETAQIAHKLFNPLMYDLGYERNLKWWTELPPSVPDPSD